MIRSDIDVEITATIQVRFRMVVPATANGADLAQSRGRMIVARGIERFGRDSRDGAILREAVTLSDFRTDPHTGLDPVPQLPAQLTPAERRVLFAICEGKTSPQIAAEFGRSQSTIRNQTKRVYATMKVNTRSALVAKVAQLGLLERAS